MSRPAHRGPAPISWSACCPSSPSSLWLCPPPIWPSTSPCPANYTLRKASTFGVSGPDYQDARVHTLHSSAIDGRSPSPPFTSILGIQTDTRTNSSLCSICISGCCHRTCFHFVLSARPTAAANGTAFIVQWENVYLQDNPDYGRFNFQAILLKTGSVIFVYKEVPVSVSSIKSAAHPVKVGLSDAYYYDSQISTEVRRRTIYEYHRVNISFSKVASDTVIVMNPRPTCVQFDSCEECTSGKIGFDCRWCPAVRRCSDGLDRKRQEWHKKGCSSLYVRDSGMCARAAHWRSDRGQSKAAVKPVTVIIPVVIILIVLLGVFWFIYAYRNPQSQSGMWLIEHRPSNLKAKLNNVRFWKRNGTGGEKYEVSMQPEGESVA